MNVDIAFSDHRLSEACLEGLGAVIRAIAPHSNDPAERFWTFIEYVSWNFPGYLNAKLSPEARERCEEILRLSSPPVVMLEKSARS